MQLTIIIPVRNRANYILRTLQTLPPDVPLIVVDNGSTDGTAQLAADFCSRHPLATFVSEPTPGAPAARNRGLELVDTEWVYFFDSDDEFTGLPEIPENPESPEKPETPESPENPGNPENPGAPAPLDLVCFPVTMVIDGKERTRDYRPTADAATHVITGMLSTQTMIFRTEWLRSIGGWDNRCRIWNDWELGLRALLHHPRLLWITDEPHHRIYVHDDSITGPSFSARWEAISNTLTIAYDEARHVDDQRVLRALDLRLAIVCGTLRRQDASAAADELRRLMAHPRRTLRLLEWCVAHGLRGAWRIALSLL